MTNKQMFNKIVDILMLGIALYTTAITWADFTWYWLLSTVVLWAGTVGTIMTAKRHKLAGLPNLVQNVFNIFVSGYAGVLGDSLMSVWYAVNEGASIKIWNDHSVGDKVKTEKCVNWFRVVGLMAVTGIGMGLYSYYMGGQKIVLDAVNNASGAIGIYMQKIERQRASWYLWGITNILGIAIWWDINPIQAGMYVAFLLNTVRGYINWSE